MVQPATANTSGQCVGHGVKATFMFHPFAGHDLAGRQIVDVQLFATGRCQPTIIVADRQTMHAVFKP
jgi:hypothetical protein